MKIIITLVLTFYTAVVMGGDSYITDTSLDHDNAQIAGTIAEGVANCSISGGTVNIGSGVFVLDTLTLSLGKNCSIVGSGTSTILNIKHVNDAILISTGDTFSNGNWSVRDIAIVMPANSSGSGIRTLPAQGSFGKVQNVELSGGSAISTGITLDAANSIHIEGLKYEGFGNGIHFMNSPKFPVNYGDSSIVNSYIRLRSPSAVGLFIDGNENTNYKINNILISGVSINAFSQLSNTIGVYIKNSGRITLVNVDVERLDVCLQQDSGVNGGVPSQSNVFVNVFTLGCNDDYLETGQPQSMTVIGGYGELLQQQKLGADNLELFDPVVGGVPVIKAIRKIEHYSDSSAARILSVTDSGGIFTNKGSDGVVTYQLPPALNVKSHEYHFYSLSTNYPLRIMPAAGDIIRPGQTSTGTGYISDTQHGQYLTIRNIDSTVWAIVSQSGQWTSE